MPKRETRPTITAAIKRVEKITRDTKDGLVQFRIGNDDLELLYELAEKERKPLGAMVREWVLSRMKDEATQQRTTEEAILDALKELQASLNKLERDTHKHQELTEKIRSALVSKTA